MRRKAGQDRENLWFILPHRLAAVSFRPRLHDDVLSAWNKGLQDMCVGERRSVDESAMDTRAMAKRVERASRPTRTCSLTLS